MPRLLELRSSIFFQVIPSSGKKCSSCPWLAAAAAAPRHESTKAADTNALEANIPAAAAAAAATAWGLPRVKKRGRKGECSTIFIGQLLFFLPVCLYTVVWERLHELKKGQF